MRIEIEGSEYEFKELTGKDYIRNKDLRSDPQMAFAQLVSKSITKDGKPVEIHEVANLSGLVGEEFIANMTELALSVEPLDGLHLKKSKLMKLGDLKLTLNPDYLLSQTFTFIAQQSTQPGTAVLNQIRKRLLVDDKPISQEQAENFSYSEFVALEQLLGAT